MKPYPEDARCEVGSLENSQFSKELGYLGGTWLDAVIPATSPRTWFLFLEEPPFADCREGNTQEELLAVTCFSKHWM